MLIVLALAVLPVCPMLTVVSCALLPIAIVPDPEVCKARVPVPDVWTVRLWFVPPMAHVDVAPPVNVKIPLACKVVVPPVALVPVPMVTLVVPAALRLPIPMVCVLPVFTDVVPI